MIEQSTREKALAAVRGLFAVPEEDYPDNYAELAVATALELIKRFEGYRSRPYLCPAGIPTIGYGSTYYLNGLRVTLFDDPIDEHTAYVLCVNQVKTMYLPAVLKLCPKLRDPKRLAAIIDFTFNLGPNALAASTLRRRINEENWSAVRTELMRWVMAAGRTLAGLVRRRKAEADLI